MRKRSKENPGGSFTDLKKDVKQAICKEVQCCLRQWGSAGRAAEVLERCQPWLSVEHLIVHNAEMHSSHSIQYLMSEGKQILCQIPGVREVFTGEVIKEKNKYQFCWSVRFTNHSV